MSRQAFTSGRLAPPAGPYSQAVQLGELLFVSGQIGRDPETRRLVPGGLAAQTACIFRNSRILLEELGRSLDDVQSVTVYLTDMADFVEMNRIYADHFRAPYPARTTVSVHQLPLGALIVIEMVVRAAAAEL